MQLRMGSRNDRRAKKRKMVRTNKIIDRLTYSPNKHKQKKRRKLREMLAERAKKVANNIPPAFGPIDELTFGSMNVDKLGYECERAICNILTEREYDVSIVLQ